MTIGMITDAGGGANGTAGLVEAGAKMAVSYANAYGKGLDGHKITLYICENQNTPAGGQTCANDMVQKGVGWLLKETYPKRPVEVLGFLDNWRTRAPRLVLRLAAEKMTEMHRKWLLKG